MTEFIKVSAMVGMFTMYVLGTGIFGGAAYRFLEDKNGKEKVDKDAALKGILISYIIGLIVFMGMSAYYIIYRG